MITWLLIRAAGVGAYLMLFGAVTWGLVATTALFGNRVAKATSVLVHQFLGTVGLVLLGVHLAGVLVDTFVPFGWLDVLVPMHSSFRPLAITLGIGALYASVIVVVSSWMRRRVGIAWWRRLHLLTIPAFAMALVHGIAAGTDTAQSWLWWTYLGTGSLVVFLLLARAFTVGLRPARAAAPVGMEIRRPKSVDTPAGSPLPDRVGSGVGSGSRIP